MIGQARRWLLTVVFLAVVGCGSDSPAPPTNPSPAPTESQTRIITLTGDISFGTVQVNTTADRVLTIGNSGNSLMTVSGLTGPGGYSANWTSGTIAAGASQAVTVRFSPTEERTYSGTLTVNANHSAGTNAMAISGTGGPPPGPRTQFGNGQFLVNTQIAPGRYFADPVAGCYWERQKGASGSFDDIIANDFVGDNLLQIVVDILPSDFAFETDSDCGTWFTTPRRGFAANISPGTWLVGSQVAPGTYQSNVSDGCYWERVRNFEGVFGSILANDFIPTASARLVEIRLGDVGFSTDGECGTWTPVTSAQPNSVTDSTSLDRMRRNRELHRAGWPRR